MEHRFTISVAHVDLCTYAPRGIQARIESSSYREFLTTHPEPRESGFRIDLSLDPLVAWDSLPVLFDSGVSWRMFAGNSSVPAERLLVFSPPGRPAEWLYAARMHAGGSRVTVNCSPRIQEPMESGVRVFAPVGYPLDQILLMYHLAPAGGVILHAAGCILQGRCLVFAGPSGAGKSTLTARLAALPGCVAVSDDRVVFRRTPSGFSAFGTPWPGEGGFAVNRGAPLGGIFLLTQDSATWVEPLTGFRTLEKLLPVVSIPWYDPPVCDAVLATLEELITRVAVWELHFTRDCDVAALLGGLA